MVRTSLVALALGAAVSVARAEQLALANLEAVPQAAVRYAVEDVIASLDGKSCAAVLRAEDGSFRVVGSRDDGQGGLRAALAASDTLELSGGGLRETVRVGVAHQGLPLDLLTAAVCTLEGKPLVLAAPACDGRIEWRPSGGDALQELALLWEAQGSFVSILPEAVVVGQRLLAEAPTAVGTAPVTETRVRASVAQVAARVGALAGTSYQLEGRDLAVTVVGGGLGAGTLMACLAEAAGSPLTVTKAATAVAALDPTVAERAWAKAQSLVREGRLVDAKRLLVKLARRAMPSTRYWNALFKVCWKLGERECAVRALQQTLRIDGRNEYALKVMARLREAPAARG